MRCSAQAHRIYQAADDLLVAEYLPDGIGRQRTAFFGPLAPNGLTVMEGVVIDNQSRQSALLRSVSTVTRTSRPNVTLLQGLTTRLTVRHGTFPRRNACKRHLSHTRHDWGGL